MFSVLVFLDYLTYRDFQNRISVGTFQWFSITWRWTTFIQKKFNRKVQLIPKNAQWHAQGYRLFKSPTSHEYTSRCSLFSELPVVSLFQESEVSFSTPDISRIRVSSIPRIRSDFYLLFLLFDLQKVRKHQHYFFEEGVSMADIIKSHENGNNVSLFKCIVGRFIFCVALSNNDQPCSQNIL